MIKYSIIKKISLSSPYKIALTDGCQQKLTWQEFARTTLAMVNHIRNSFELNLQRPYLFLAKNSIELVLLGAAFATLGIPFQGIDYHLNTQIIGTLINQINAQGVFLSKELYDSFFFLNEYCPVYEIPTFITTVMKNSADETALKDTPKQAFRSYAFTSGTTGIPKIAIRTKSFDQRRFEYMTEKYHFNPDDIHLTILPMYHVSATGWLRLFLGLGCTVVIGNFETGCDFCELLHTCKISATVLSPHMLSHLITHIDNHVAHKYFNNLRFVMTGGKNCLAGLKKEAIEKLGNIIYEYYGSTETGVNTLLDSSEALVYPGSVGRTFSGNDILVLDSNGIPLKPNQIGRVAIYSYMNMDNYLNQLCPEVIIGGVRYLLTTDYGYLNSAGYLYLAQRKNPDSKNIFNFYAIENATSELSYVADSHVFETTESQSVGINIVLKKYLPYKEIKREITTISQQYGFMNPTIRIVQTLNYTQAGKIKFLSTHSL